MRGKGAAMGIPESQLETWSHQGSITQSSTTYNTIKAALEIAGSPYASKDYKVFLQGSYGNGTNIYAESDVDVVIQLNNTFHHDLTKLPDVQQQAFKTAFSDAEYPYDSFKKDVLAVLTDKYGDDVNSGDKAIYIAANGGRRKADVIAAVQYRRYHKFLSTYDQLYDEGICFFSKSGEKIANYPKYHSSNLTAKHKKTNKWFKPMARVLKNLRGKLIDDKVIDRGVAPSYHLEGLLYNVPDDKFTTSYADSFVNSIRWIQEEDRSKFVCANEQYYLLREDSPVTWRASKCDEFLAAAVELWNHW
jgi:hypothetical protein